MAKSKTRVFRSIGTLLTLQGAAVKQGRKIQEEDLSPINNAALVVEAGKVVWVGSQKSLPKKYAKDSEDISLGHRTVLPGFVECHTHTLFAGQRSHEFEQRLQGVSYQEIARQGGGILSTMRETRKASIDTLKTLTSQRIERFAEQGVTTLEIKTGYALDEKNELKCLRVLHALDDMRIVPTFMGAHAVPPEFKTADDYLEHILAWLPRVRKLASRLDIFIEKGFFEIASAKKYLLRAKELGFQIVIHADQLTLSGGTDLSVELEALSADHVIQLSSREIAKIAQSATTAVLLPLADLYMKCDYPPARQLIDQGARVALATDFNPGTCPSQDLATVGLLARLEMKMSLPEVIGAYTVGASHALGLEDQIGSLEAGKSADFLSIEGDWTGLFYSAGSLSVNETYLKGSLISSRDN